MRPYLTHGLAFYLGAGTFSALLMAAAIPALNWRGKAYIMLVWPQMIVCARQDSGCDAGPPDWLQPFAFEAAE
jgi:hypothetical protein